MDVPLRIIAHNLTLAPGTEAVLREETAKLQKFYDRLLACRATVEAGHRYPTGEPVAYTVRLDLKVPGGELVITDQEDKELWTAIQRVFEAARRRLQDHGARRRVTTRSRKRKPRARVSKLFPYEGYGFLETRDGREIYFHRNSVLGGRFEHLELGSEVQFAEESGTEGPQASSVSLVGKGRRGGTSGGPAP